MSLDILRKVVACNLNRTVAYDTTKRNHGDFGGTAAYVDNHVALGRLNVETDTESSCHRFEKHIDIAAAGVFARVAHCTDFNLGGTGRDADHHAERG